MNFRDEWPTLSLLILIYGAFFALTMTAQFIPNYALVPALALIIALHSSLQHWVLHGHPFKSQWLSDLTVFPAIGLFVPYLRFKDTHLAHHYDPNLTDPYDDPERNFVDCAVWQTWPALRRAIATANNTLLGRMAIGPALSFITLYRDDLRQLVSGNLRIWRSYVEHAIGVAVVMLWVGSATETPLWAYVLPTYLGLSLLEIRTYLEHQAHDCITARSVIIEDCGPLALLFLNNNYHAVHHASPKVVWHQLRGLFQSRRDELLRRNGGYSYRSYTEVFARYFLRTKDPVPHPMWTLCNHTTPRDKK